MAARLLLLLLVAALTTGSTAVDCPSPCRCNWVVDSLYANCSHRGLLSYPSFNNVPVEHLDLSGNRFDEFPREYADMDSLLYLDLSDNFIASLDERALLGYTSLRTLLLANNSITSWASLNPNEAFKHARSLTRLSLRGNRLNSFGNAGNLGEQLSSQSLSELDLSASHITVVGGDLLINHLPSLERLSLANNQLVQLSTLPSHSLRELDLSNCSLVDLHPDFFDALLSLESLNLSRNSGLQFGERVTELRILDVSYCNLEGIDLSGLPALTSVRLRGNLLRRVDATTFANNTLLETLDLSENVLSVIGNEAFNSLKRLKHLNLAYNDIAYLDRNLIRGNDVLMELDLSRNILQKFTKVVSNSVRLINMSWCEINSIDSTALSGLSVIQRLDLSNNLIHDIPNLMRSESLQYLNLANCR